MSELLSSGHTAASEGARGMNLGRGACEPAGSPVRHSDRCFRTNRWCHQTAMMPFVLAPSLSATVDNEAGN